MISGFLQAHGATDRLEVAVGDRITENKALVSWGTIDLRKEWTRAAASRLFWVVFWGWQLRDGIGQRTCAYRCRSRCFGSDPAVDAAVLELLPLGPG